MVLKKLNSDFLAIVLHPENLESKRLSSAETYSEPSQTSNMERFGKKVNS